MFDYDFRSIEQKWQARWEAEGTFVARVREDRPKFYCLEMFPYPSGSGLHVGHLKNYVPMDAFCRFKAMSGLNVLHPMGWDAFGQPAENEAIRTRRNPREMVPEYAATYRRTLKLVGCSYDWEREINSSLPDYYRWTQWFFLLLYKRGLAYRATSPINWCPSCKTVLANEEVKDGRCWRCDTPVEKKPMPQWFFRITAYAERLLRRPRLARLVRTASRRCSATGSAAARAPRSTSRSRRRARCCASSRRAPTRSSARRSWCWRPSTRWSRASRPTRSGPRSRRTCAARRRSTEIDRMNTERATTGVFTGAYRHQPGQRRADPDLGRRLRADGLRHRRHHGRSRRTTSATSSSPASSACRSSRWSEPRRQSARVETTAGDPRTASRSTRGTSTALTTADFKSASHRLARGAAAGASASVNYRMRDWLISRQRYWGAPIPIVHCPTCGEVPVPEDQLAGAAARRGELRSRPARASRRWRTSRSSSTRPARRAAARRGARPTRWAASPARPGTSCASPTRTTTEAFAGRKALDYWLPVDLYVGGVEHARSHLLYARFWTKVLYDAGLVSFNEPFLALQNQGSLLRLHAGPPAAPGRARRRRGRRRGPGGLDRAEAGGARPVPGRPGGLAVGADVEVEGQRRHARPDGRAVRRRLAAGLRDVRGSVRGRRPVERGGDQRRVPIRRPRVAVDQRVESRLPRRLADGAPVGCVAGPAAGAAQAPPDDSQGRRRSRRVPVQHGGRRDDGADERGDGALRAVGPRDAGRGARPGARLGAGRVDRVADGPLRAAHGRRAVGAARQGRLRRPRRLAGVRRVCGGRGRDRRSPCR